MKKLKLSKKWLITTVAVVVVAAAAGVTAYKWTHRWPITFEGTVTDVTGGISGEKGCAIDDDCMIVVGSKTITVICGWVQTETCPLKSTPVPPAGVGTKVRVTAQKDKNDSRYNLHCEKCGVTILK